MKAQHPIPHRPRSEHHPAYNAMVARLLTMKDVNSNPRAQQAILEEGEKLLKQSVWDVNSVREKCDVIRDSMRLRKKVHFARIFPICSEKGSELPEGDPDRKFKDDVWSKAMMLKTRIRMQLSSRNYLPLPLHWRLLNQLTHMGA